MSNIAIDDVVIGSGPTGWAACMGIWARGGRPVVIDIGYSQTRRANESVIRNPMVKPKLKFDSDHMYRFPLSALGVVLPDGVIPLSGARGGYSTVWGSGIQPVSEADVQEAPIAVRHSWLKSSKDLLSQMDFLGRNDLLSRRDPWPVEPHDQVATSTRFRKILKRADNERLFESTDVLFGSPRLAITGSTDRNRKNACTLCGQCMSGCPEGSIFDSGIAIEDGIREFGGEMMTGAVTKILREDAVSQPSEVLSVVEVDVENAVGATTVIETGMSETIVALFLAPAVAGVKFAYTFKEYAYVVVTEGVGSVRDTVVAVVAAAAGLSV